MIYRLLIFFIPCQMMNGYYKNEKATTSTISSHGWLKTGDMGYYDDQGNVFVVSRLKELIKYKAFQVISIFLDLLQVISV